MTASGSLTVSSTPTTAFSPRRATDFRDVIAQRRLTQLWSELEDQLRASLRIQPMIISNGDESGWLMPAHLATLGFYILRVRSNLVEIRQVLDR